MFAESFKEGRRFPQDLQFQTTEIVIRCIFLKDMALTSLPLIIVVFLMNYDFPFDSFEVESNWWIWCRILGFRHVKWCLKRFKSWMPLSIIKALPIPSQYLQSP